MKTRCRIMALCAAAMIVLAAASALCAADAGDQPVNLELKDVDVRAAIEALFKNSGRNHVIDGEVQGVIPSVSFKDVTFDQALRNLLKAAGLVFRVDEGIYYISKKPVVTATPLGGTAGISTDVAVVDTTTVEETTIEKVPLSNTGASEMLAIMGGGGSGGYGMGGYGGMMGGMGGYGGMMGGMGGMMGGMGGMSGGYGGMSGGYGGMSGGYGGMSGGYGGMSGGYGGSSYGRSSYGSSGYGGGSYRSW